MTQTNNKKPYLILAAIDYSTVSEQALQHAIELTAAHPDAELHVVHVTPAIDRPAAKGTASDTTDDTPAVDQLAYQQLQTYVAVSLGAFEKLRNGTPARPLKVVSHLRMDAPSREIPQLAADLEADLVVVGMCGRSAITRFFLGSVAESVARLAPCPVLVFRPKGLPLELPKIEPPCPKCVQARVSSEGKEYWCAQHRQHHGQRNVYHYTDRKTQDQSLPLSVRE
jgi:nucleotide-binding universal stress UspA family protein